MYIYFVQVFDNSENVKDTCSQAQYEIALDSLIKKVIILHWDFTCVKWVCDWILEICSKLQMVYSFITCKNTRINVTQEADYFQYL